MSKTRQAAKKELEASVGNIDHALVHLKRFEGMGYGEREDFKQAIILLATSLMEIQDSIKEIINII